MSVPSIPIPRWAKSGKTKNSTFGWGEIFERDGKRCVYCLKDLSVDIDGLLSITQDHLFPQSQGMLSPSKDQPPLTSSMLLEIRLKISILMENRQAQLLDQSVERFEIILALSFPFR